MTVKRASTQKSQNSQTEIESIQIDQYTRTVLPKPFTIFFTRLAVICCSTNPDAYFSKEMVRYKFGMSEHRINEAARLIVKRPHVENGHSPIAQLRDWFEVMKEIPKNPKAKKKTR